MSDVAEEKAAARPVPRRRAWRFFGRWMHRLIRVVLAVCMLAAMAAGGLAWRLAQGPLDISRLIPWLEDVANQEAGGKRMQLGRVALAWEDPAQSGHTLTIRIWDLQLFDAAGTRLASLPEAAVALSARRLLLGELAPYSVTLHRPRLVLVRAADGTLALGLGAQDVASEPARPSAQDVAGAGDRDFGALLLRDLARPPGDTSRMGVLRFVRIEDAEMYLTDLGLGTSWAMPHAMVDLQRLPEGGVQGNASLQLEAGEERVAVQLRGVWKGRRLDLEGDFTPVSPAVLARAVPPLAALAVMDARVGGAVGAVFDSTWQPEHAEARLDIGPGTVHLPEDTIAIRGAQLNVAWSPERVQLRQFDVQLPGRDGAAGPLAQVTGTMLFAPAAGERHRISLNGAVSPVNAADLPRLWPRGVAPNPRRWVTENITAGMVNDARVHAELSLDADFSDMDASKVDASMSVQGATVHWLRPIPPMEDVDGSVAVDLDAVHIQVDRGRQGRIRAQSGSVTIALYKPVEIMSIEAVMSSSLQDVVALIQHPRLKLFERRPLGLDNPTGNVQSTLRIALPLWNDVDLEMLNLHVESRLSNVHLGKAVMGQDLDGGAFEMTLSTDGMRLAGTAQVLGTSLRLVHEEDFRTGPPTQVASRETVSLSLGPQQFATLGMNLQPFVTGSVDVNAQIVRQRNGAASVNLAADLGNTALSLPQTGWSKPAGRAARASAVIGLRGDRLSGVNNIRMDGDGLSFRGALSATRSGAPNVLQIASMALGNSRLQGEVRLPTSADRTIRVNLQGPMLDISGRASLSEQAGGNAQSSAVTQASSAPGTPLVIAGRFERVLLTRDAPPMEGVSLILNHNGRVVSSARASGSIERAPFEIDLTPAVGSGARNGRRLRATAQDAGALLRALGIVMSMRGGALTVTGMYDDANPAAPLNGSAEITNFRLQNVPGIGRILQAMTLYGLVEMLGGEGLGFTRLTAPFTLSSDTLELRDARAFSASLGLTARGRINFVRRRADMTGTVVPAYFFNSLLGNIPVIGRLFSAEEGGGLFAVNYSVRGPLDDPSVTVNPLSAVTPGFLRGVFGIFDQPDPAMQTPATPQQTTPQQTTPQQATPGQAAPAPSAPAPAPAPTPQPPPRFVEPPGG